MSDYDFAGPGPWPPSAFMAGTPSQQLDFTITTPSSWFQNNDPLDDNNNNSNSSQPILSFTPQCMPVHAIVPQQMHFTPASAAVVPHAPPLLPQVRSIAPQQLLLPPREIKPDELKRYLDKNAANGLFTICVDKWIGHENNDAVVSLLGEGTRIISSPLGVFSRSPLARYRVAFEENDSRVRLIFDCRATLQLMSYDMLMHFLDQLSIGEFAQFIRANVPQQAEAHRKLEQAVLLIKTSQNGEAITLIDWLSFGNDLGCACYLARYLDRPISWLRSPVKERNRLYPLIARQLQSGYGAIELYLSDVISLAELKRWAADPNRNYLSNDGSLEPIQFQNLDLPEDLEPELICRELPQCLDSSLSPPLADQEWEAAKELYCETARRYQAGANVFDCTKYTSQRYFRTICLPAGIFESLKPGTEFYGFCHEDWDARRIQAILSALAKDPVGSHTALNMPSNLDSREQMGLMLQQFTCTRLLIVENPLGVCDSAVNEISSLARWSIGPSNLAQQLALIESGQLATANRHPQDGLDSLPLLVLRNVHLWTINELMRVLYEFYAKPKQAPVEPLDTLDTAIRDLNSVPRLLIEMETINQQPITLLLDGLFKRQLAVRNPSMMVSVSLVPTPEPVTLRDKILFLISKRDTGFSWREMMEYFYQEIDQPSGSVYVTDRPTEDQVFMVKRAIDLRSWRDQSNTSSEPKPLCLSYELLTSAKLKPCDLYLYWSISPQGSLCIESPTVDEGLRLLFLTMESVLAKMRSKKS